MLPQNVLYYGQEAPLPARTALRAGPLSLIYENGDLRSGEQNVRPSSRHPREGVVHPVPEPEAVELAT